VTTAINADTNIDFHNAPLYTYQVYGLTVASNFAFASNLLSGLDTTDVIVSLSQHIPDYNNLHDRLLIYKSPLSTPAGAALIQLYRSGDIDILRFSDAAEFFLYSDRIECYLLDSAFQDMIEIWLLGQVFSYFLERNGIPILHASAVALGDYAIAFLAVKGSGKTSFAASFMQKGYPLLSDDLLALDFFGEVIAVRPGYPQMRMWDDQVAYFLAGKNLPRIHPDIPKYRVPVSQHAFGDFCTKNKPLSFLYLLERDNNLDIDAPTTIHAIPSSDALIILLQHSFSPNLVQAAGFQPERLKLLTKLVETIPVRTISYNANLVSVAAIRDTVLNDIKQLKAD